MAINKWELINFLHSCGIDDVSEALRLKSLNVNDIQILKNYKLDKKSYQRWANEYSSSIGKSVMNRKRGRMISMKCNECGSIIRWDYRGDRTCENCGLVVDKDTQRAERIRFALRELGLVITDKRKRKIKDLLIVGKSEEDVIRMIASHA